MARCHVRTGDLRGEILSKAKKQKLRAAVWGCELLETRCLLATVSWITQGSGDWFDGLQLEHGAPPQPGDDVVIYTPGVNIVVTYDNAAPLALGNMTLDEGLILNGAGGATWNGGTLDGSGVINNDTTLTISGSADKILKDGIELDNESVLRSR